MPETLLIYGLLAIAALSAAPFVTSSRKRRVDATWSDAARALGLEFRPGSIGLQPQIQGEIGSMIVRVRAKDRGLGLRERTIRTVVTVEASGIPSSLGLAPKGARVLLRFMTGDAEFDDRVSVRGDFSSVLAVLTGETRQLIRDVLDEIPVFIEDRGLSLETDGYLLDSDRIQRLVRHMVTLGEALSISPSAVKARLHQNAKHDAVAKVRLANLRALIAHYEGSREADDAARFLLETSESPDVILHAALSLGPDGFSHLAGLVEREGVRPNVAADALHHLANQDSIGAGRVLIKRILENPKQFRLLLMSAIEYSPKVADDSVVDALIGLIRVVEDKDLGQIPRALGEIGDRKAERHLVELLRNERPHVQVAAARALGALGSLSAVEALRPYTRGVFREGELKRAAIAAIAKIQADIDRGQGGALSITEGASELGELTLVDAGELSLTDRDL